MESLGSTSDAKIIQLADENQALPDGSKIIYAESDDKIVLYHKVPFERGVSYVFDRQSGSITINGVLGSNKDKRQMVHLGRYLLESSNEEDLVTIDVSSKDA